MNTGLSGKCVAITGGASGIGRAAARAFLSEGCAVAVCGRREEMLEDARAEFARRPFLALRADATVRAEMEAFSREVLARFGRVDVWVNNAGMSEPLALCETDEAAFDRLVNVNFKAVFFGCQLAARLMKERGGVIINTSSFTSVIPTAGKALYGATKAAVNSLTQAFAAELAPLGIRVAGVVPGYIETDMTRANIRQNGARLKSNIALCRLGTPADMAGAYVFLASDAAAYVTGTQILVAGGKLCVQNPMFGWERADGNA